MSSSIPYDEKFFKDCGAMISPNGNVQSIYTLHEVFARNYCNGEDYDYLRYIKYLSSEGDFYHFKNNYQFYGTRKDIDEWCHSKLKEEELKQYQLWMNQYQHYFKSSSALDYMIFVLGYDKIESILTHTITTTHNLPHIRFYNYYLMDWDIQILSKAHFNSKKNLFEFGNDNLIDLYHSISLDSEAEEEIQSIKSKVKKKDLPKFFR